MYMTSGSTKLSTWVVTASIIDVTTLAAMNRGQGK